jgi:hypothetical protein
MILFIQMPRKCKVTSVTESRLVVPNVLIQTLITKYCGLGDLHPTEIYFS